MKVPTVSPLKMNSWDRARAVDVFPLVPVTCTAGCLSCGSSISVDQGAHPLGPGDAQARVSQDALEVLMAVEPRQSVAQVHFSAARVLLSWRAL